MIRIFLLFFFLCSQSAYAQLIIRPILNVKDLHPSKQRILEIQPAGLPFWDDFSRSKDNPDSLQIWGNDTTRLWNYVTSQDVLINSTLAINPPSFGVATFDGLKADGSFHGTEVGLTDQLQSDTINLFGKANVILSFFWQGGGNVEIPDKADSLILEFFQPEVEAEENNWQQVWGVGGEDLDQDSIFTQEAIFVPSRFLTDKFMFRFRSYGDQDGPFDAWHIDWIYMNEFRQDDSFFYRDQGFNLQLTSPFSPYRSLPVSQFKQNPVELSNSMETGVFNLEDEPDLIGPTAEYILVLRETTSGTLLDSVFYGNQEPLSFNPDPLKMTGKRVLEFDGINLSTLPDLDSAIIEAKAYFRSSDDGFLDGSNIDLKINDTVRATYLLHNYFAYDDGTAEYAVGTNISGGQVAVLYWLPNADTLTAIDIYFPNIAPISTGTALNLRVWKTLDRETEPLRSEVITVFTGERIDQFTRYKLRQPVVVSDTFFIGYEQNKNEYVGVGFDRSSPAGTEYIWENKTGQWEQNQRLRGALMMRPVFAAPDSIVTQVTEPLPITAYPNPTNGLLRIKGRYDAITITDFSGRVMLAEPAERVHDLSKFSKGLYLLTVHKKDGDLTVKIVKQ